MQLTPLACDTWLLLAVTDGYCYNLKDICERKGDRLE